MTVSDTYGSKTKTELIEELVRLNKEIRSKNDEIAVLRKKLLLYKSIK